VFDVVYLENCEWRLTGTIVDNESVENLLVHFGSDLVGECAVAADGAFSCVIRAENLTYGTASASFTDSDGWQANTAWRLFG
jgi:hypothetical protein